MVSAQNLLEDLTEPQRQAVTCVEGPLLVVAGAGSGKTRVITRRVAWLLHLGIAPNSIVAITFTNKAAGEMKSRVSAMLGRPLRDWGRLDQPDPIICTFHSLCLRILRHYGAQLGLAPSFSIFDSDDQERLIKEAIKEADLSTGSFTPSMVQSRISDAKNKLKSPQAFESSAGHGFVERAVARIYHRYQALLERNNALDFDDLLMRTAFAFRDHPDILKQLQERFGYILIDEYQDTNHAQYVIAHALALRHQNLCVVGDPDQSVYAWRGADIQNILDFEEDYPNATVIRLEQNYRSTKTILRIASRLIAHNRRRKEKTLFTQNADGQKAALLVCGDEHAEAHAVAGRLAQLRKQGVAWSQMAIFYRVNALSRVMEDALRRAGIPYRIARGVDFYHRKEIKDVLAYLRLVVNPADEVSLGRIANTPSRGISDATLEQLTARSVASSRSLWEALRAGDATAGLNARAQKSVASFVAMVEGWRAMVAATPPPTVRAIMERIVKTSGLEDCYRKTGGEEGAELANIAELITAAAEYDAEHPEGSLADYLAGVSLVSDVDALKETGGAVTLMTLHAAKGLEFPVVAIVGVEDMILPHQRVREHPEQLEEERRLCFVGVTRAQHHLILSRAVWRTVRGVRNRSPASRFLAEMGPEDLEVVDLSGVPSDDEDGQTDPMEEAHLSRRVGQFRRGQLVRHPIFGIGRIAEISSLGAQRRAIVEFQRYGRKPMILEYAKIEPVG